MSQVTIRKANPADLDEIKNLADAHKHELGFVLRPALTNSIQRDEVFVAENSGNVVGFIEFHHRRDGQTTLYHIAVQSDHRRQRTGRQLVDALIRDAREHADGFVQLKCPVDLEANQFYERLGFSCIGIQPNKHRKLAIWRLSIGSKDPKDLQDL